MRKLHMVLLGVFGAGMLLGGIGTGIAIGEYSGLEYQGEVMLGEESLVTKEFYYNFSESDEENVLLSYCYWGDEKKESLLVEDEAVPVGEVRYVVTYNEEMVRPKLICWEQEMEDGEWKIAEDAEDVRKAAEDEGGGSEEEPASEKKRRRVLLELRNNWYGNELDVVMRNKDRILEDLKEKKIGSYEVAGITEVEIRVNPESAEHIEDQTR